MQNLLGKILLIVGGIVGTIFGNSSSVQNIQIPDAQNPDVQVSSNLNAGEVLGASTTTVKIYTQAQLAAMATAKLTTLPLGDNKYVTDAAKVGYIYLCHVNKDSNQGAGTDGPWIQGTTWLPNNKVSVDSNVKWSAAWFKNIISGVKRLLTGNDLPINHTTGTFPINKNSTAGQYDQNPNSIKTQNLSYSISASPIYHAVPTCMGGESGIMLSGVALFNGFDAQERDAQAHEVQDNCSGHPQEFGEYHYHGLSNCFKDISETKVLGFALDGFPITGPQVGTSTFLHTKDLDVCHGLTSQIILDGKKVTMYHYVMTEDFPYSVSCFRGTPIQMGQGKGGMQNSSRQNNSVPPGSQGLTPPQAAIDACKNKKENDVCDLGCGNDNGACDASMGGTCHSTPDQKYFACIPQNRR